jgi:hypothetical protein
LVEGFKIQTNIFKPRAFKIQGNDLNFKRRFGPMNLNSIYFIELKGRFRMEIGLDFEWTWVNWARNIFPNIYGLSFKVLRIKQRQR